MRANLIRWAVLAIAVPVAAAAVRRIADAVEQRQGAPSRVSRGLRFVGEKARKL